MSDFEMFICCLLIPAAYVLTYIAGKYDVIGIVIKMFEEKIEDLKKDEAEQ